MQLDLAHIAIATGGTLVTAAGKKATKPSNLQHHTTFGIKKPKAAKLTKHKISVPARKPTVKKNLAGTPGKPSGSLGYATLNKLESKILRAKEWLLDAGFKQNTDSSLELKFGRGGTVSAYVLFENDTVTFSVSANVNTPNDIVHITCFDTSKLTQKNVTDLAAWLEAVSKIRLPNVPKFML